MKTGFYEHREMVLGIGSFLFGAFLASGSWGWSAVLSGMLLGGFFVLRMPKSFVLGMILLGCMGALRYEWAITPWNPTDLAYYHNENDSITLEGVVDDYPDVREDRIKLTVGADHLISGEGISFEVEGKVLVTVDRYPEYSYGDRLKIRGILQEPAEFDDFSYRHYLRRYGIDSVMYHPHVEVVEIGFRKDWRYWIFLLKAGVEDHLNRLLTEPHAGFSAGLLLGSRRGIPPDIMEDFTTSGLTHIIAISGYNITLIIVFVSGLFRFLERRWQTLLATLVIFIFVVLVGATAAVVRASIMGVLGLWAIWFGRPSEVTRLLFLTAALMTIVNPFILVDDVGFQLSFAATCGLVYMTPYVEAVLKRLRLYDRIPEIFSIREAFVTTLAAQTFSVPVIVASFGRLSLIAPFANVAVVSFIPLAMLWSFLAMLVSYFWWNGGLLLAYVDWFFLELIIQIAHWSAQVPFASVEL